ncbi:hypothetical protein KP509_14G056500 [Ceratopteris richardii]|uniref:SANTA domain-containing protein n=1 Tax=Ceratopteris richardii TaxID=49495 RepID=A0A8T2TD06_CERRI|nr:hypothetical protein KP509_14G056500 [Ceratopteris richardii]
MATHGLRLDASARNRFCSDVTHTENYCNHCCGHHSLSSPTRSKFSSPEISWVHQQKQFARDPDDAFRRGFCSARYFVQSSVQPPTPHQDYEFLYPASTSMSEGTPGGASRSFEPCSSSAWLSSARGFNLERNSEREDLCTIGYETCSVQSNQVTLYSWYLIKCEGASDSVGVSVGGFLGTGGIEKFESASIVQRMEKCILMAQDGVKIRLAGLINGSTSVANGFSQNLVESFLSGFPYTWNHLLYSELRASKMKQPDHQGFHEGLSETVEVSQLSFKGSHADQLKEIPFSNQVKDHHGYPEVLAEIELYAKQTSRKIQIEDKNVEFSNQTVSTDNDDFKQGLSKNDVVMHSEMGASLQQCSLDASLTNIEMKGKNEELNNQAITTDHGNSEIGTFKDDLLITSDTVTPLEKDILNSSHSIEKDLEASRYNGQFTDHVRSNSRRTSKAQSPHTRKKGGTVNNQSCVGSSPAIQTNQCTRMTRSMHKVSMHQDHSKNNDSLLPDRVDNGGNAGSYSGKNVAGDCHRQASFTMSQKNNKGKSDHTKTLNTTSCASKDGDEDITQETESKLNVDANLDPKPVCLEKVVTISSDKNDDDKDSDRQDMPMLARKSETNANVECSTLKANIKKHRKSNKESDVAVKDPGQITRHLDILPALPSPRVPVPKQLVSEAFGLKTSRSGRLLVPPLAHWCGQSLLRDKDGGIIAISDGSKDEKNYSVEMFKFKPPTEAGLQRLQKRLCQVAVDYTASKKRLSLR